MSTIPTMLSDTADRLENFIPMQVPEGDDWRYWTLDLQLAAVCFNDREIHDALQLYESVEFASAFKERCDRLYKLAESDVPNKIASLARMISDHAHYCRSLAEAIGTKYRDNPPVWDAPKLLVGKQSAAAEPASKEIAWSDDAAEFLPNKDAVALSKGKMSGSGLSKLLTPTGPMRYMRKKKPKRCKVHIGDFMRHLKTIPGGLSENEASDIADEFLSSPIEGRKAAEQRKRASRR